jgi:hypothetical protein
MKSKKRRLSVNPSHALFSLVFILGDKGLGFTLHGQVLPSHVWCFICKFKMTSLLYPIGYLTWYGLTECTINQSINQSHT